MRWCPEVCHLFDLFHHPHWTHNRSRHCHPRDLAKETAKLQQFQSVHPILRVSQDRIDVLTAARYV